MKLQRMIAATFLAGLLAAVAASPAEAHERHRGPYGHPGHRHHVGRVVAVRPVVVPSRIVVRDARYWDPYYDARVWYAPHHHYHAVYAFPVLVRPGVVAYAPHTYCDGRLILRGDVVLDAYGREYDDARYRWDDRVSGYVAIGGPNFRIGVGF